MIKVKQERVKLGNVHTAVANGVRMSNMQIGVAIASQAKLPCTCGYGGSSETHSRNTL